MAKVRSSSQLERGNLESDLAALYLDVSKSEGDPPVVTTERPSERFGTSLYDETAQVGPDMPQFDPRKQRPTEIRKNWEKMLTDFEQAPDQQLQLDPPVMEAVVAPESDDAAEPPVIVQSISFVDANQVIPLNWKLSNRQKQGYLLAWRLCSGNGTELRRTLDRCFTRTGA